MEAMAVGSYPRVVWCVDCNTRRLSTQRECVACQTKENEMRRPYLSEPHVFDGPQHDDPFTEALPVDDSVRGQAEAETLIHLNRAISGLTAAMELTFNDVTFERLVSVMRGMKALQRDLEAQA
jgi:hypothetical protein